MIHKCEFCNGEFKQKNDLKRHMTKKNGCIPVEILIEKEKNIESQNGKISELRTLFKSCLDILRNDAEHLVGDEALHELSLFLILKLSEKHILNNTINIYDLSNYKKSSINEPNFKEYLELVKFSNLNKYADNQKNEGNLKYIFDDFLWKKVLSTHPKFKDVFEDGKKSNIKESSTFKKIILKLNEIDFSKYDHDILGEAYESIFVDAVFGAGQNKKSELGQFFTPTKVKNLMVSLVKPILKDNGEIETFLEPASGTGGILNTVIKHYKEYIKIGKIKEEQLREQLIKNMYGIEIKGKIYNLCLSNMLINTGEILPNVICSDSIRKYHKIKVDTICANPPFSVKIEWDELIKTLGSEDILNNYIPIPAGGANSEVLFLQMMIHCLNINGRCATVWLDGTKLYGKSSGYDTVREYLMKSCDLQQVILCPSGTFTSTASKTCILFFIKKKERKDVVEIIGSGNKRNLKFVSSHTTKKVNFYDYNPESANTHLITEVDIKDIALNNYSLNYTEYNKEIEEEKKEEGIEWIELGKICEFQNGINITKEKLIDGEYPVVGGGSKPLGYHNEFNVKENTIIISKDGAYAGYVSKYDKKIFVSNHGIYIHKYDEKVLKDYIYYYLKLDLQNKLYKLQSGAAQPGIKKENVAKLKIQLPSLEKQKQIVEFLDKLYEKKEIKLQDTATYYENQNIFKLLLNGEYNVFGKLVEWYEQSVILEGQIQFFKDKVSRYLYFKGKCETEYKKLGELCKINIGGTPRRDNPDYWNEGKNIWVSIRELNDNIIIDSKEKITDLGVKESNVKLIPKNTILFSFKLSIGKIGISGCDLYTNEAIAGLIIENDNILMKYLYYILKELDSFSSKGCIGGGSLNKDSLSKIKLPVPSLEKQKEIIEYCESNNNLIKQLENEIEQNKIQANLFLSSIVKKNKIEQDELSDDEAKTNQNIIIQDEAKEIEIEDEVKEIEIEDELEEIEVEDKTYYVKANIIYNKKKNGSIGKECGIITKNGKVKFNDIVV